MTELPRRALHQIVPCYARWDAIGSHVLKLQELFLSAGLRSDVYAHIHHDAPGPVKPFTALEASAGSEAALLYHLSIGSTVGEALLARPERLGVVYHNIGPHDMYGRWEPTVGAELAVGRDHLERFADRAELALAVSSYNARECRDLGYRSVEVVPLLFDTGQLGVPAAVDDVRPLAQRKEQLGGADWLFVGRIAPPKAQHDILTAFAAYRHAYDPAARLTLIGGSSSDLYQRTLQKTIAALGLGRAVHLLGSVEQTTLRAHYANADVFVCMSDHEGFCVPLLEAMAYGIPIVAFAAAAVPETLAGGGVLLPRKDPAFVAAAVHRTLSDRTLRERLVAAGRRRLQDFDIPEIERRTMAALAPLLAA